MDVINGNQTGFTAGCDTSINLLRILIDTKNLKNRNTKK
jgi:hypothetical protein